MTVNEANRKTDQPLSGLFAPRENSRRAQRGHTKCSKASYGPVWPQTPELQGFLLP